MDVRDTARELYKQLHSETTTTGSVGAGITPALGATPATNKKRGRCSRCKDMFSPKCKCPNVKAEGEDGWLPPTGWISPEGETFYTCDHGMWAAKKLKLSNGKKAIAALFEAGWIRKATPELYELYGKSIPALRDYVLMHHPTLEYVTLDVTDAPQGAGRYRHLYLNEGFTPDGWVDDDKPEWPTDKGQPDPDMLVYYDGESGEEIVRMSKEALRDCSARGDVSSAVSYWAPRVSWVANLYFLQSILKDTGGYDDEDVEEMSEEEVREKALWIAALELREQERERVRMTSCTSCGKQLAQVTAKCVHCRLPVCPDHAFSCDACDATTAVNMDPDATGQNHADENVWCSYHYGQHKREQHSPETAERRSQQHRTYATKLGGALAAWAKDGEFLSRSHWEQAVKQAQALVNAAATEWERFLAKNLLRHLEELPPYGEERPLPRDEDDEDDNEPDDAGEEWKRNESSRAVASRLFAEGFTADGWDDEDPKRPENVRKLIDGMIFAHEPIYWEFHRLVDILKKGCENQVKMRLPRVQVAQGNHFGKQMLIRFCRAIPANLRFPEWKENFSKLTDEDFSIWAQNVLNMVKEKKTDLLLMPEDPLKNSGLVSFNLPPPDEEGEEWKKDEGFTADGWVDDDAVGLNFDPNAKLGPARSEKFWVDLAAYFSKMHQSDLGMYAANGARPTSMEHVVGCVEELDELISDLPPPERQRAFLLRTRLLGQKADLMKETG